MPITQSDVAQINRDFELRPKLTVTLARQLVDERTSDMARRGLVMNYGEDFAASVESAILQAAGI